MSILVTDLDGTLLGGERADRGRLAAVLSRHREITVVWATGRSVASVRQVLADPLVPQPSWIIADVGASVVDGAHLTPLRQLQARLRRGWPGTVRVRAALAGFPHLIYQDGLSQDHRCSFFVEPEHVTDEVTSLVRALGCTWLYSSNRYLDVLPAGASKGAALTALAREQRWPMSSVLVAGDSLNDLSLFQLGAHGVIVGNAHPALRAAVPAHPAVHRPDRDGAAGILSALQHLGWVEPDHPLVIGYHRPPVQRTPDGWRPPSSPNGILPTLRSLTVPDRRAVWAAAGVAAEQPQPSDQLQLTVLDSQLPLSLVPMSPSEWTGFVHRACKEILWPIVMSQPERLRFEPAAWAHYRTVNARFTEQINGLAATGATVWLHDYNLWLVPGQLRAARPDLRIGLFHHTPFPPPEVFAALPTAAEISDSLACLDWVGFHTRAFADNCRRTLAPRPDLPRLGVHPLGVDRAAIEALTRTAARPHRPPNEALVLSVERLDYAKAPVQKIDAVDDLLKKDPRFRGRLRFRLICPPPEAGITAYESTRRTLQRRVDEVNRSWRTNTWQPIDYLPRCLSFAEVVEHYLSADVFWVTSLQDGMNLTAKEFIAAQAAVEGAGVLVLSRYTGAAAELGAAALLTDPHSPHDLVTVLHRALMLDRQQRRARAQCLSDLLGDHHPRRWATDIITAIETSPPNAGWRQLDRRHRPSSGSSANATSAGPASRARAHSRT